MTREALRSAPEWLELYVKEGRWPTGRSFSSVADELYGWYLRALATPPAGPIQLSPAQEKAVKDWAADDRLWTTQETVEINLRTFARVILAATPPAGETPQGEALKRAISESAALDPALKSAIRFVRAQRWQHTETVDDCPHCNVLFIVAWAERALALLRATPDRSEGR